MFASHSEIYSFSNLLQADLKICTHPLLIEIFSAYNPKACEYSRTKYKKKLEKFEAHCELIQYLGKNMSRRYKEPEDRLIDFDNKLTNFMSLKTVAASGGKP